METNKVNPIKSNRRKLIIILAIFALPVVLSMLLYFSGWRPSATANYGELILPAHFIDDVNMQSIDGKPVKFSELHGKWTMVYFDNSGCAEECMNRLYFMRQTHHSQGKYLDKIQRVLILTDDKSIDKLKTKLIEYPEMQVLTAEKSVLSNLLHEFGLLTQADIEQRNIYLLDQQGNLMMRYKSTIEPAGVRKDLAQLLKYSAEN
jgi:cytochrome oxidase Cu insertion factor (SCO1/SenC/PrrC family)